MRNREEVEQIQWPIQALTQAAYSLLNSCGGSEGQ